MALLAWEAPALPAHTRTTRWYLIGGAFLLAGAAYGILSRNWSFALALLLTGGLYGWMRNKPSALHRIVIREDGFAYDDAFTPWEQCRDFSFLRFPGYTELHITRHRGWDKVKIIQTGTLDIALIRETLERFLTERKDAREHFLRTLARSLQL